MRGCPIIYSAAEMAWLETNHLRPIADYHAGFCFVFGRSDVSLKNLQSLRKRMGWKTGRTGQFIKGAVPSNKGQRCAEGKGGRHPNSRATQFQKGALTGKARVNYKSIGTERTTKDGYVERKANDEMPLQKRWRAVHLIRWEALHGPLPAHHALKCVDGNKANTDPTNWQLIHRGLLPRLNDRHNRRIPYDAAPSELKGTLLAIAQLEQRAKEVREA